MSKSESAFDSLQQDPQAARILGDPATLKNILSSPETQKLVSLLQQVGGNGLKTATQNAAKGQPEALLQLLEQVTGSPEGAKAAEEFQKKTQF